MPLDQIGTITDAVIGGLAVIIILAFIASAVKIVREYEG